MTLRVLLALAVGGVALMSAVVVAVAQTAPPDPVAQAGQRQPAFPVGVQNVQAQSLSEYGPAAANFANAPVPVLAPPGLDPAAKAAFAQNFRATSDGYFSFVPLDTYDIVVNGTRNYAVSIELIKEVTRGGVTYLYEEAIGARSASWLHREYNTDYLIEFECKVGEAGANDCVSEEDVLSAAENMVLVGGAGQ